MRGGDDGQIDYTMILWLSCLYAEESVKNVGPQIGMNPPNRFWDSPIWNIDKSLLPYGTQTDLGSPRSDLGIAFLVFFSVTHKTAFSMARLTVLPDCSRSRTTGLQHLCA